MTKQLIDAKDFSDLDDLIAVLTDMRDQAKSLGYRGYEVYAAQNRVALVAETLSDGSKVLNLNLFAVEPETVAVLA
jgi:hypothetical protein